MDNINIPVESIPPELKSCEQILRRAKELKNSEPVITYWCCFSAAQAALKIANRSRDATAFLMSLLDVLEEMKAQLVGNEAVTSEAAGSAFVENFALRVFLAADNADRAGDVGKNTVRKFVVAGQFIEVLKCFESGLSDDMDQKLQYARWKAADLAKALREGRVAKAGPPQPPTPSPTLDPFPSQPTDDPSTSPGSRHLRSPPVTANRHTHTPSPGRPPSLDLPSATHTPPLPPVRHESDKSGQWSTAATPGLLDEKFRPDDHSSPKRPSPFPSLPSGSPTQRAIGGDGDSPEKKNVRFAGPDGASLSPSATVLSLDSYVAPSAPPPSEFSGPSPVDRPTPSAPAYISSAPPVNSANAPPPPPPPSLASYPTRQPPSIQPQSNNLGLSSPPPPPPTPHSESADATPLTRKQIEQTQKHARWAISALEFDDVDTARLELKRALALLGG